MKTQVTKKISGNEHGAGSVTLHPIKKLNRQDAKSAKAFTLIELLTVIAVIGVLAALLFPVFGQVKKRSYINHANAEMAQLETAIDRYKAAYGFYPPGNPGGALTNQLYFELEGTTNNNGTFVTLDGSANISSSLVSTLFGVGGFINCNSTNASAENGPLARNFLPELKPGQIATYTTNPAPNVVNILVSSLGGPDAAYQPLGLAGMNPWRYNSYNPTNNPGAYDLWIQLVIGGKTNLICNWSSQVQINNPLP
ncbi:MAG: type II secretion system protein [Verrucomicrobiota bacterium]|jgi:prepilin-type N-terminal cleavage/methylation domain-containing protein